MTAHITRRLVLIAALTYVTACQGETTVQNEMLTDIEILKRFIVLPVEPASARYSVVPLSENDSQFFAELTFDQADFKGLTSKLMQDPAVGEPALVAVPKWFDAAQLPQSITASDEKFLVPGADLLPAQAFAKAPYNQGFATIGKADGTLLLFLFTE